MKDRNEASGEKISLTPFAPVSVWILPLQSLSQSIRSGTRTFVDVCRSALVQRNARTEQPE